MNDIFYLFGVSAALIALLASVAIRFGGPLWIRIGALVVAATFLGLFQVSLVELLGRPKPTALEWKWLESAEAVVIATQLQEGKAIYLWLGLTGLREPRSYTLPWNQDLAKRIHAAEREAESNGTSVRVRYPFSKKQDHDHSPVFYAAAQPPRPPKEYSAQHALDYRPPRGD